MKLYTLYYIYYMLYRSPPAPSPHAGCPTPTIQEVPDATQRLVWWCPILVPGQADIIITILHTLSQYYIHCHNITHIVTILHILSQYYTHCHNITHIVTILHKLSQYCIHFHNVTYITAKLHKFSQYYRHYYSSPRPNSTLVGWSRS